MSSSEPRLSESHQKLIADSGIIAEVARERGYRTVTDANELRGLGFFPAQRNVPALLIPLCPVAEERNGYVTRPVMGYQSKPDSPCQDDKGKIVKYETPSKWHMRIDCPPRCQPLLGNPAVPLIVTEGPRKADAAASRGLCCIALLGVWNWRGSNDLGGKSALADWENVPLNRPVYIAFDSDVSTKREVRAALVRLKAFLESRGATVKIIYLPCGPHGEKVGLDDFFVAGHTIEELFELAVDDIKPGGQACENSTEGVTGSVGPYRETKDGLIRVEVKVSSNNRVEISHALTNFTARIIADVSRDDGAEITRAYEIEAHLGDRLSTIFSMPATQFAGMRWPTEYLGAQAVVYAGTGTADHARVAIQLLSSGHVRRAQYAHTGWRKIANQWIYLHASGGVGATGEIDGIEVTLPPELAPFKLNLPPNPVAATQASLKLLDLAPDRITVPTYGAIWRAILGGSDFSILNYGPTGVFKTEEAALIQSHFGAGFDARHLPTSFTSTANTNEALAFTAKDAVLVVDELHPPGSGSERESMFRDASRLLRSQGNVAGRGRMRADGTLRPPKPPRGLLVATGEELPRGQSVHARLFTNEIRQGDISPDKLTACQRDAAAGIYAQATATFIQWLAPQLDDVRAEFERLRYEVRAKVQHGHARTSDIRAQLTAVYSILIAFLLDIAAIDDANAEHLKTRIGAALEEAANMQAQYGSSAEPSGAFIRLLGSTLGSGAAAHSGLHWRGAQRLGTGLRMAFGPHWYRLNERDEWQPQGSRIGWIDNDDLFLDRDSSYRAAQPRRPRVVASKFPLPRSRGDCATRDCY